MAQYKNILKKIDADEYLNEAVQAANFINTRKVNTEHGLYWSISDAKTSDDEVYYDEICLYAGSAGIIHYFLQLFDITKEEKYLEDSKEAAKYILYRWDHKRELSKNFSKWAFTTGYAGIATVLLELNDAAPNAEYVRVVKEINEAILQDAKPDASGEGYTWSSYPGIVGDAGTILYLIESGKKLGEKKYIDFAIEAGKAYLNKVHTYEGGGRYYLGVDPTYFHSDEHYIDPNYPMGTAGIGFLLLRLYEESGDEAFLRGTDGILEFHKAVALQEGDAALLPHGLPTRPDTYYLGYCHGPVGTSRYYYKYHALTGNEEAKEWEVKLANGIIATGAPENHTDGYWNVYCYCCGTAGMVNLYLGMWAATGDDKYFVYAKRSADHMLGWTTHEESANGISAKWFQAFVGADRKRITTNIGMYDGAAGIGWALAQMYLAEKGQFHVVRTLDDPYPASKEA